MESMLHMAAVGSPRLETRRLETQRLETQRLETQRLETQHLETQRLETQVRLSRCWVLVPMKGRLTLPLAKPILRLVCR
jgi:hypothetical protein